MINFHNIKKTIHENEWALVLFFIIAATVVFSLFKWVPIQPDEINTRLTNSRFFIDEFQFFGYQIPCIPYPTKIAMILYPEAILWSLNTLITNTFLMRLFPFLSYVLFAASASYAFFKYYKMPLFYSILIGSSLFFLSFSNASSIWNVTQRTENLLFLSTSLFIFLGAKYDEKIKNSVMDKTLLCVSIIVWLSVCYAHPKAMYFIFLPLGLVLIYFEKIFSKIFIVCFFSVTCIYLVDLGFIKFIKCDTNINLQNWAAGMHVNATELFTNPVKYYYAFKEHWAVHWSLLFDRAPNNLSYIANPDIGHVPSVKSTGYWVNQTNLLIRLNYFLNLHIFFGCFFYICYKFIVNFLKNNYRRDIYLIFSFSIALFAMITHNRTLNGYDVQTWSILMNFINIIFIVHLIYNYKILKFPYRFFYYYLCISTLLLSYNLITYYKKYYKVYTSSWNSGIFAGPGVPINYLSKNTIKEIQSNYQDCSNGLNPDIIFIDDRSYIPLEKIPHIFPITYTAQALYFGRTKDDGFSKFNLFLKKYNDPIFIGACEFLPELPNSFYISKKYDTTGMCCFLTK